MGILYEFKINKIKINRAEGIIVAGRWTKPALIC